MNDKQSDSEKGTTSQSSIQRQNSSAALGTSGKNDYEQKNKQEINKNEILQETLQL